MRQAVCFVFVLLSVFLILPFSVFANEGIIEINSPTAITEPGSYILVDDIFVAGDGIRIYSSNVTLDLNGFSIMYDRRNSNPQSEDDSGIVIALPDARKNIEITNGTITGFPGAGICTSGDIYDSPIVGSYYRLSNLRIAGNGYGSPSHSASHKQGQGGINLANVDGFIIDNCIVRKNDNDGIFVLGKGLLVNNVIGENTGWGLFVDDDSEPGRSDPDKLGYRSNVFYENNLGDVRASKYLPSLEKSLFGNGTTIRY